MADSCSLLVVGPSTRAAAFSALRAGLTPRCADLFADADLQARCPVIRLPSDQYPHGFVPVAAQEVPGPWMYTGGLENRPGIVRQISERRPLWGIGPDELHRVRSPAILYRLFQEAGLPFPALWHQHRRDMPPGQWLVKPWAGTGGTGVRRWTGHRPTPTLLKTHYFQEYIEGKPCAAIYVGDGRHARLLGVTRQLVGESWLHAAPFHYCGSIGPLRLRPALRDAFERVGMVLAEGGQLRGLFGVDCVLRGNVPWPVEVNPRYTASVEVLEYGAGVSAMALHRSVFDAEGPAVIEKRETKPSGVVGKAILFARAPLVFPSAGPWTATLRSPPPLDGMPDFADIPHPGERIQEGRPILSLFVHGDSEAACLGKLRAIARSLDRWLYER